MQTLFCSSWSDYEDDLVRSASVAMIASRCSPYLSAFVGPRPCTLISSLTLLVHASAMAISVASVNTQYAGSCCSAASCRRHSRNMAIV
jgi:hypothetical protein